MITRSIFFSNQNLPSPHGLVGWLLNQNVPSDSFESNLLNAWAIIYRGSDHQKTTKNYQRWSKLTVRKKKQYGGLVRGDSSRFSHQNQVKEITKEKISIQYFLRIWKNGSFHSNDSHQCPILAADLLWDRKWIAYLYPSLTSRPCLDGFFIFCLIIKKSPNFIRTKECHRITYVLVS